MLKSLEVLNGEMTPKFDTYNSIYTINVSNDIDSLVINYEIDEDSTINILNNENLQVGENIIYLEISNMDSKETYTLYVNKEELEEVTYIDPNLIEKVEVVKKLPNYLQKLLYIAKIL